LDTQIWRKRQKNLPPPDCGKTAQLKNCLCFAPPHLKAFTSSYADQIRDFPARFFPRLVDLQKAGVRRKRAAYLIAGGL
jgi:hypothetical protein